MAFQAGKLFGTFEKRTPGPERVAEIEPSPLSLTTVQPKSLLQLNSSNQSVVLESSFPNSFSLMAIARLSD